jgi:hypothetical protein
MALVAAALLASLQPACVTESVAASDEQMATEDVLGGMTPSEYWAQFLYRKAAKLEHHFPSTRYYVPIGQSGLEASLALYPRADGSFTADYTEMRRVDAMQHEHVNKRSLSGRWTIDGSALKLEGIGRARAASYNGQPAMMLTFDRDLHTPGLAGKTAMLVVVRSSWGPDNQ